jgi:hypothetical protein
MDVQEIRELFKRHGLDISRDDVWEVRPGTPVVLHKALERLAVAIDVQWEHPQVLRMERDEAVILVSGYLDERPGEWSIGEALVQPMKDTGRKTAKGKPIYEPEGIGNYAVTPRQASYPYAMAEKRGKDRVILKLAGLHGAYSEEEADDFKQKPEAEEILPPPPPHLSKDVYIKKALERMKDFHSASELLAWAKSEREKVWAQYGIQTHDEDGEAFIQAYRERKSYLEAQPDVDA